MKKFNKFAMLCSAMALLSLTACEASVTDDTDGATETDTTTGSDSATGGDTSTGSDVATGPKYTWVAVDGSPYTEPDCGATSSPGADLDVIALYRGGKLIGVGKPGTAKEFAAAQPACAGKKRGTIADITGPLTTKMYSDATPDTGYYSLSNNRVYVQIGACTQSTEDIKVCDGAGEAIELQAGDEIDIYEVDGTYKKNGGTSASGIAPDNCVCLAEDYWVGVAVDQDTEPVELGTFKGSKSAIPVSFSK